MKSKVIAFYLPQFHQIPENDEWWGAGFTEWRNVTKAKKYFHNHYQPKLPADLGFYDLRVPEIREQQAELAKQAGIYGFCYWHYWFGNGKRLLERPFNEVLSSGKPDFPFCLAWANESWKGFSYGADNKRNMLIEQKYLGIEDYTDHFYAVLPAFKDSRYIRQDNKPVFLIYKPFDSIEVKTFIDTWKKLALQNGFEGICFIGCDLSDEYTVEDYKKLGLDYATFVRISSFKKKRPFLINSLYYIYRNIFKKPYIYKYEKAAKFFVSEVDKEEFVCPTIITGWDHTPRSGDRGLVLKNYTPKTFEKHLSDVFSISESKKNNLVFLKSWNEWAEGNFIEPDLKFGKKFLDTLGKFFK